MLTKGEPIATTKRVSPLNNPSSETSLSIISTNISTIERTGDLRVRGKSEGGKRDKGCIIFAMLKCYSCGQSSRVSFYYNEPPPYVRCQGCGQLFPFGSFGCWAHSNTPI